jgi:hypothetical protein
LNSYGSPWTVRWFFVDDPINRMIITSPRASEASLMILDRESNTSNSNLNSMSKDKQDDVRNDTEYTSAIEI